MKNRGKKEGHEEEETTRRTHKQASKQADIFIFEIANCHQEGKGKASNGDVKEIC
jgi:hypothetical protein